MFLKAAEVDGAVIGDCYLLDLADHTAHSACMPATNALVSAVADR
jgi:hypothetical protein